MRDIQRQLPHRLPRRIVLDFVGTANGGLYSGVVDALARQGVTVRVRKNPGHANGAQRSASPGDRRDESWYVIEQGSYIPDVLARPGAHVVASISPLGDADDAQLGALQRRIENSLRHTGNLRYHHYLDSSLIAFVLAQVPEIDKTALNQAGKLNDRVENSRRCRCAIVAVPGSPS